LHRPSGPIDLQPLGFSRESVSIDAEKFRRRSKLPIKALERLTQNGAIDLVEEHPVEIWNGPTVELVEEMSQSHIQQFFER
jgi:hypothetical protein